MPELPEVELSCRSLERWGKGRRLCRLEVLDPRVLRSDVIPSLLEGQVIQGVRRRAKLGIMVLETHALVFHLRMTGQWLLANSGGRGTRTRARLYLEGERILHFDDVRCLGTLEVFKLSHLEAELESRGLGPEPWPDSRSGTWWRDCMKGLRGPIKPALMKQERVAGLGNIAGSESCFRAGIDPRRGVPSLSGAEWEALARGVHDYIESTIAAEEGQDLVYLTQGGENPFQIYGREECPQCGRVLQVLRQAGRGTWCCTNCQD